MTQDKLIEESNRQFIGAWTLMAEPLPGAQLREDDGIAIANAGVPLFFMNAAFLTSPLKDSEDGRGRAAAIADAFAGSQFGWMAPVCEHWIAGEAGEAFISTLTGAGLAPVMRFTGMSAGELAPPVRPLPADLEIRPAATREESGTLGAINCAAYQMDEGLYSASVTIPDYWSSPRFGYLGRVDGEPVAAGALIPVDGIAYIGWMATVEAHRGKGYAEAIMRHALEEERRRSGITRTVLHATEMGEPVYRRLGYQAHTVFTCWAKM